MPTYTFVLRRSGREVVADDLRLHWEVNGSPMSDDYTYDEADEFELWRRWVQEYGSKAVGIYWAVHSPSTGAFETAPFQGWSQDFLTHYTWPKSVETGEKLNWLTLPVMDRRWTAEHMEKGGFIQQATGWKPSPLHAFVDPQVLAEAAGLYYPEDRRRDLRAEHLG